MSATYEGMSPGGHETYATSIFSKIKTYLDSNPYGYVSKTGGTMTGNLTAPKFIGALQGNADTASKLGSSNVGSVTQPIYLNGGTATACTYTLGKSVPSDAVFTDHYAWTDITGKPSTFTPSTHYHYELKTIGDQRTISTTPNDYVDKLIFRGLKNASAIGSPGGGGYSYLVGLRGWGDSSGGDAHELAFNNHGVYYRHGATTTWGDWVKIFTSADTYTGTLTSSQVTSALGFTPTANTGTITSVKTTAGAHTTINVTSGAANFNIPTKTSHLTNDSGFVTTDTKNTAGSTDTSSKIFLIGATSQAANPQTYSQDTAYVGTDGCLYSGGTKVLTAHQDISGKADKSATVSTVTWSGNKLTKTINGTTSDVVSAATILGNLTSSQVTTALGYTPASVNTTYDFESPDDSISFNGRAVGSVVTVDMTVNGKVSTEGDTISGDYINTADFSEGGVYGKRVTTYGSWGIDVEEYLADSLWSKLSLRDSDILLTKTWDGTNTSLRSSITSLRNDKVNRSGDTMTGTLNFAGSDIYLKTLSSSSDDSGNIVFYYGNGAEKCRIWTSNEYTAAAGPNYRVYKKDGSALYSGRLATMADLSWGNISGKPSYLPTDGGTMTGIEYSKYASQSWVNSLTKSAITLTDDIGFGGWICGPTKNGRIAIATYKNGDDILYFGYGERGRTANSYTRRAYWNGANGLFASSVILGESMLRSSYIGRNDSTDSGYINHVNTGNTAYAPTRASAFTTMSCKYTKTNIVDISEEDALKLLDIRPVNFDYIEEVGGQKNQIGVLAEDTYEVLPKVVSVPDDYVEEDFDISKGIHQPLPSVDYAKFVPYLIKLVQMQQKEIDILKKERT